MKLSSICLLLTFFFIYVIENKSNKSNKSKRVSSTPEKTLKAKENTKKEVTSKKTTYVDEEEEISCECSCLSLNKPRQESPSRSRKQQGKDIKKPCMSKKCRGRPKIENLAEVQEDLIESPKRRGKNELKSRTEKVSRGKNRRGGQQL